MLDVEQVDCEHSLQHIVQKIIVGIVLGETRTNIYLRIVDAHKAHDIASRYIVVAQCDDIAITNSVAVLIQIARKH